MLNKNTLGVKKGEANKKQHDWAALYATKNFDIEWGQEMIYLMYLNMAHSS